MKEKLTFADLKELLNRLPTRLDNTEVTMVILDENGSGKSYPIQSVVYGKDVSLWSPRPKVKEEQ